MNETPRTDAILADWAHWQDFQLLCRQLERELAEARNNALEEAAVALDKAEEEAVAQCTYVTFIRALKTPKP